MTLRCGESVVYFTESFAGAEETCFGSVGATSDAVGDFVETELVPIEEGENSAVVGVELGHGLADAVIDLFRRSVLVGDGFDVRFQLGLTFFEFKFSGLLN